MDIIKEFISAYGVTILYSILTTIFGYIGLTLKKVFQERINDETKKNVARTCVKAVEQLYKDLHGDEKLNKALEACSEILQNKGITITEINQQQVSF